MHDEHVQDLCARASGGDRLAADELLRRYLPALRAYVRARMGPLLRAKESQSDLVQSICREILQGMGGFRFEGEAAFKGWLFTLALRKLVARHRYWNSTKRMAARDVEPRETASDDDLLERYASVCTPSAEAAAKEEIERIERAFDTLPDHYREVIGLARLAQLPLAEVGRSMGRSEIAAQRLLARALARLSAALRRETR